MTRPVLATLTALTVAASLPSFAPAKGPSEASIAGPGLESPIEVGAGEPGAEMAPGAPVMELAEAAGFFPAAFGQVPSPMLAERPAGDLGPRYVVTYVVPGPNGEDLVRQDLYPYAKPVPVSYMAAGQRLFETERTNGGWFTGSERLRASLVAAGLPASAPAAAADDDTSFPWPVAAGLGGLVLVVGLGALAILVVRRQPRSAT